MCRLSVPTGEHPRQTFCLQRSWSHCHEVVRWRWSSSSVTCYWLTSVHGEQKDIHLSSSFFPERSQISSSSSSYYYYCCCYGYYYYQH